MCRVISYFLVVTDLAVCDRISRERMWPAAGQIQIVATAGGTFTDLGHGTDALHLEKWIFRGIWCCREHISTHLSLKRMEATFKLCGYGKTGSYMLLFLTSGSLLYVKLSWFIKNNPETLFNHKLMSYFCHRWLSSSSWDPCSAKIPFLVLSPVTDLTG